MVVSATSGERHELVHVSIPSGKPTKLGHQLHLGEALRDRQLAMEHQARRDVGEKLVQGREAAGGKHRLHVAIGVWCEPHEVSLPSYPETPSAQPLLAGLSLIVQSVLHDQ